MAGGDCVIVCIPDLKYIYQKGMLYPFHETHPDPAARVNTAKWVPIARIGRKGTLQHAQNGHSKQTYVSRYDAVLHRRHQLLLLRGQTTTQNKTQTNVVCGRSRCIWS